MRVAIIENTRITHHGQIGVALNEAGALVDLFRPFAGDQLPAPGAQDAVVVFGGEQSAVDDEAHPYLPALARLMGEVHAAGRPLLGICLGSQLLARAFGAENLIGSHPEFGWVDVTLTEQGRNDPVIAAAGEGFPIFQWHSDSFTLPPGAVRLASSAGAQNQAFRLGDTTYGTQFHFEANRAVVADWSRTFPDLTERLSPGWHNRREALAETQGRAADAAGLAIARAWVGLIRPDGAEITP